MSRLIVRFNDSSLESLSWIVDQSVDTSQPVEWQTGSVQNLNELAKNHNAVVLVIAQQDIYLTSYEIPNKASRQVLSSIEFQIEDQLAQDVELQHFSLGDHSSNPVAIAVLDKNIMQRCVSLIQKYGLTVTQVIPEIFLCPWSAKTDEVNIIESHEGLILRYGDYLGIKCRPDMCEATLDLIAANQKVQSVNYYLQHPETHNSTSDERYTLTFNQLTLEHIDLRSSECINLLQRQFQMKSVWSQLLHVWKWVLGFMVILIAVTGYNKAIALQQLETRLSHIKGSQYELLKNYLPANIDKNDNLKKELLNLLKQNQSGKAEVYFLGLLSQFTQAKSAYTSIIISKLGYQNKRLSIDVTSNQLSQIESLLGKIESTGQAVKLENLTIKPDVISGQFVLDGASE